MKWVRGSVLDRRHSKEIKPKMKARQIKKWCMLASCVIPDRRKIRISLLLFGVCIIVLIILLANCILFTPSHVASSMVYLVLPYFP